jgi:hypothetical protein
MDYVFPDGPVFKAHTTVFLQNGMPQLLQLQNGMPQLLQLQNGMPHLLQLRRNQLDRILSQFNTRHLLKFSFVSINHNKIASSP